MPPASAPDEDLVALKTADGEPREALAARFERHRARLLRMVDLRLPAALRQRVNASDVLQDAYLEISNRLDSYLQDPQMPFFLWIRFITAQRVLKLHRFHVGAQKRDVRRQVVQAARPSRRPRRSRSWITSRRPACRRAARPSSTRCAPSCSTRWRR